jgi:hypothetical protein
MHCNLVKESIDFFAVVLFCKSRLGSRNNRKKFQTNSLKTPEYVVFDILFLRDSVSRVTYPAGGVGTVATDGFRALGT